MTTRSNAARVTPEDLLRRIELHLHYTRGRSLAAASDFDKLWCLCYAVRDFALDRQIATERTYSEEDAKQVFYVSMEFLIGRLLVSNIV